MIGTTIFRTDPTTAIQKMMDGKEDSMNDRSSVNPAPLDKSFDAINLLLEQLEKQYKIPYQNLVDLLKKKREAYLKELIPVDIFSDRSRGMLETLVIYLKDHKTLSFRDIGILLKRDNRTIWSAYHKATQKNGVVKLPNKPQCSIPLEIFSNRALGPTESVIVHLHEQETMPFCKIATLLKRDPRTIWSSYTHAQAKLRKTRIRRDDT